MTLLYLVLLLALAFMAYVRAVPTDPARWHQPIEATEDADMAGGAIRVIENAGSDALARIDAAARGLPRTRVIAGSLEEGRITYMTRSLVFGFPDFTTVEQQGDTLRIKARLRFGQSDLGVNRKRVEQLLQALD